MTLPEIVTLATFAGALGLFAVGLARTRRRELTQRRLRQLVVPPQG